MYVDAENGNMRQLSEPVHVQIFLFKRAVRADLLVCFGPHLFGRLLLCIYHLLVQFRAYVATAFGVYLVPLYMWTLVRCAAERIFRDHTHKCAGKTNSCSCATSSPARGWLG